MLTEIDIGLICIDGVIFEPSTQLWQEVLHIKFVLQKTASGFVNVVAETSMFCFMHGQLGISARHHELLFIREVELQILAEGMESTLYFRALRNLGACDKILNEGADTTVLTIDVFPMNLVCKVPRGLTCSPYGLKSFCRKPGLTLC
jgi:hypothetical protein